MDGQRAIARRLMIGLPPDGPTPAWEKDFSAYPPAGVIVFGRDFRGLEDLRRLTRRLRDLARPRRIFIAIDEEGGWVSQLGRHLVVPPNALALARGAGPGDLELCARVTAARLRALGVDWDFAPVADIHSQPRNPVIGARAFGSTPGPVSAAVATVLGAFQAAGLGSCLKHFPGHGDTLLDSHLTLPRCDADRSTLEARELAPFRENLARANAVMTAHVVYSALDGARPATFSRAILVDLLRGTLGFEGVCVTDALEMRGAAEGRPPAEAAREALEAGSDLLLFAHHDEELRRVRLELARALVDGGIDRAQLDLGPPRLAGLDRRCPEPTEEELARAIDTLTPSGWESRLEAIVERGLETRGTLPGTPGAWRVTEPAFSDGPSLRQELERAGAPLATDGATAVEVIAIASRVPLPPAEVERLRGLGRERPVVLIGLQNDGFLDAIPEAALRLSAADATPLTRRVVARTLAGLRAAVA